MREALRQKVVCVCEAFFAGTLLRAGQRLLDPVFQRGDESDQRGDESECGHLFFRY